MKKTVFLLALIISNLVLPQTNYLAHSNLSEGNNVSGSIVNFNNGTLETKLTFYSNGVPSGGIVEIGNKYYALENNCIANFCNGFFSFNIYPFENTKT